MLQFSKASPSFTFILTKRDYKGNVVSHSSIVRMIHSCLISESMSYCMLLIHTSLDARREFFAWKMFVTFIYLESPWDILYNDVLTWET